MAQIILLRFRGLGAPEHVAVEEARKVRRMGRGSPRTSEKRSRNVSKERAGRGKNGAYKVQEAEGANCQIRARRMKRKRNGGKEMEEA